MKAAMEAAVKAAIHRCTDHHTTNKAGAHAKREVTTVAIAVSTDDHGRSPDDDLRPRLLHHHCLRRRLLELNGRGRILLLLHWLRILLLLHWLRILLLLHWLRVRCLRLRLDGLRVCNGGLCVRDSLWRSRNEHLKIVAWPEPLWDGHLHEARRRVHLKIHAAAHALRHRHR